MLVEKPTEEETEYWNQVLHDHRLGMGRGKSTKVDYLGGENELKSAEHDLVIRKKGRRVKPTGAAPE